MCALVWPSSQQDTLASQEVSLHTRGRERESAREKERESRQKQLAGRTWLFFFLQWNVIVFGGSSFNGI